MVGNFKWVVDDDTDDVVVINDELRNDDNDINDYNDNNSNAGRSKMEVD